MTSVAASQAPRMGHFWITKHWKISAALLAVAMASAVYVVTSLVSGRTGALCVGAGAGLVIAILWLVLPLARRQVGKKQ